MQQNNNVGKIIAILIVFLAFIIVSIFSLLALFKKPTEEEINEYVQKNMKSQEMIWEDYYDM